MQIVEMGRVGDDADLAFGQGDYERLVAAEIVDEIDEVQLLQSLKSVNGVAQGVGIPADGALAGDALDTGHAVGNKLLLLVPSHVERGRPTATVRAGLVPALYNFARDMRIAFDRHAGHE